MQTMGSLRTTVCLGLALGLALIACAGASVGPAHSASGYPAQHSGYITVNETRGHHLFYWLFESQRDVSRDPVVLWVQGGPGASGTQIGLFYENGPFSVDNQTLALRANPYAWSNVATVIYIDQPIGTGWAYSDHPADELDVTEQQMMPEVLELLEQLFVQFPQYSTQPLYLFGESYGGHYIPVLSSLIMRFGSASLAGRFAGVGIGDGWIDPLIQFQAYIDFSQMNGLLTPQQSADLTLISNLCISAIGGGDKVIAAASCNAIVAGIFALNPGLEFYDIRIRCPDPASHDCYDFTPAVKYMEQPNVKAALGLSNSSQWRDPTVAFSVISALNGDEENSYQTLLPALLAAGKRVLCYNGQFDFAANYVGGERWMAGLQWPGQQAFNAAELTDWSFADPITNVTAVGGLWKRAQGLSLMRIANAGHMVPMNVPGAALAMFEGFLSGDL